MATDLQALMDDAVCIDCNIPPGMQLPVLIVLAARMAGVSSEPAALIEMAKCVDCNIPPGMQLPVLIALADKILNP